jgi:1-acyl-sn-glycerol-3-phosphate acyltransferase
MTDYRRNIPMNQKNSITEPDKRGSLSILSQIKGSIAFLLLVANTLTCFGPLMAATFMKVVIPVKIWRVLWSWVIDGIATYWISVNNTVITIMMPVQWNVRGLENLEGKNWYLVLSNHQTWVDIVVLQKIFNHQIPFLKFFLKKELIWVPVMGICWWALDFPFMKRYSESFVKKNPHLKGKDLEITRKACRKFRDKPVSVMNFVEGTRFTPEKHLQNKSPFNRLLRPKAGGTAFVLSAMGDLINYVVNVTITYPEGAKTMWEFLCGEVKVIDVTVETIPVTEELRGDYSVDPTFRERIQTWLNGLWENKDRLMERVLAHYRESGGKDNPAVMLEDLHKIGVTRDKAGAMHFSKNADS